MKETKKYSTLTLVGLLLTFVGSFFGILLLAVVVGVIGHLLSISLTVVGVMGVAKLIGFSIAFEYSTIFTILLICGIVRGVMSYVEQYFNHFIAFKLLAIIRNKLFTVLRKLAPAKLEGKKKGDIISMITSDIETLELFYAHTMSPVCIAVVVDVILIVFASIIASPWIGLYFGAAYLLLVLVVPTFTAKKAFVAGKEARTYVSAFSATYLDQIKGSKELVIYNKVDAAIASVKEKTNTLTGIANTFKQLSALSGLLVALFIGLLNVGVLMLGIGLGLEVGVLMVTVVSLMSSFGSTIAVAGLRNNLANTFASAARVKALLDEEPEVEDITDGKDFEFESIKVKDLSFGYVSEHKVLDNISFELNKGEIVALVGESGIGKSTILKLLLRFYQTEPNTILYNNVPIEEINTQSLKNNVAMVSQSTFLFNKSIRDNLLIAKPNATDEQIVAACKNASIYDFIEALPNKFETIYGKDQEFSFGEKQRLGLARAFLSDASLILLDEPTSNVDVINEGIILKSIKENKHNKTMLIVSHRSSVLTVCDRTIKL